MERTDSESRPEMRATDDKKKPTSNPLTQDSSMLQVEGRDDVESFLEDRPMAGESNERDGAPSKPSPAARGRANDKKKKGTGASSGSLPRAPTQGMNGPVGPRMFHPSGPFPPNFGHPHDFRGQSLPPNFSQMPPIPHPGQSGPPFAGNFPPPPHPGYPGANFHPAPFPGPQGFAGMPFPNMQHPQMYPGTKSSDSASVSSSKDRGANAGQRKKRTIDGVLGGDNAMPFRRTHSSSSTSSTVTAGNNLSIETPHLTDDVSRKGLPPLSSRPDLSTIPSFEEESAKMGGHRREFSGTSTASSLSVGGFSMTSYEGQRGAPGSTLSKASPKRRKGQDGDVSIDEGAGPVRFQQLSVKDSMDYDSANAGQVLYGLSGASVGRDGETPVSKNTKKSKSTSGQKTTAQANANAGLQLSNSMDSSVSPISKMIDQGATPPIPEAMNDSGTTTDEHLLNRHLRGHSFTPLPHAGSGGESRDITNKSPTPSFGGLAPQLSWDAPSLGDLADWEEQIGKNEEKRPGSTTSMLSHGQRGISPAFLVSWRDDVEHRQKTANSSGEEREFEGMRLLSPHSDSAMQDDSTTPLPVFFDHRASTEERENVHRLPLYGQKPHAGDLEHIHQMFLTSASRSLAQGSNQKLQGPPTPVFSLGLDRRDSFGQSPRSGNQDFFPSASAMFGMHAAHGGVPDRVRNLRGRAPPGAPMFNLSHLPATHHPSLTSPIGLLGNKNGMWGPPQHHHSPLRMPHIDLSGSKRKCVPLKPPVPSKFQGDMEKMRNAPVPEFTSLVNFPAHMSQKQSANLPEGMRCCVMCGQACPCSQSKKKGKSGDAGLTARKSNGQDNQEKSVAIIPTQNKGLCTLCDVNVWVVAHSGLEIKWCKGCKNFRPWAAFGDKGLATKCLRCRDRQREKYALQKEEKEKARLMSKHSRMKL